MSAQDVLMAAILCELELASGVSSAQGERTSHGKNEAKAPPAVDTPHLAFRARYDAATGPESRREVIEEALTALRAIRYARRGRVDCGTREGKLLIGTDERHWTIVCQVFDYSKRHVYRMREEARQIMSNLPPEQVRFVTHRLDLARLEVGKPAPLRREAA